jgi:type VI secretion system protein ImpA
VRHTVHLLLLKKKELDPDPIEVVSLQAANETPAQPENSEAARVLSIVIPIDPVVTAEPQNRIQAVAAVAAAAAFLRKQEPLSPAPYLMMRGLRWGELRSAAHLVDSSLLEAPSTELRQQIKRLALAKKWKELIDTAENAMSLPCSRAWLDLQRLVVGALTAMGDEYEPIAAAIRSELRALLNDLPELLDAILLDDTPAANAETRAWLQKLREVSAGSANEVQATSTRPDQNANGTRSWLAQSSDAYVLAKDALKAGQQEKAFAIMRKEITQQRSGRGRFERTMQLIELCRTAGKDAIAQPLLDDIANSIENHKLDDWEDPEMVASALAALMKMSKRIQDSATEKRKLFERICRLDPVQALSEE